MARTYLVFGDIEGKLDVLRVECTKCPRKGRYSVPKLIEKYGRKANMMKCNASKRNDSFDLQKLSDLSRNWSLLLFGGCMVLFHLANASMLPLVSQNLAHDKLALSPMFMAGLLIVPQVVVAIFAPWIGYWSEHWGRKPLLLAGFAIETVRALLFAFISDPWLIMAAQVLDGATGAIVTC
jgi:hypothetical protein